MGSIVVESMVGDIGGEVFRGIPSFDVEAEKVADGLAVFHLVEASEGRVLAGSFEFFAGCGDSLGEGVDGGETFGLGRLGFVLGWHFAKVELVDDFLPVFLLLEVFDIRGELVEAAVGFLFVGSVALIAMLGEEALRKGSLAEGGKAEECDDVVSEH